MSYRPKLSRRTKATNPNKLPGSWRLFVDSLKALRANWKKYLGVIAIVNLPGAIYAVLMDVSADSTVSGVLTILTIVMNSTLVWLITRLENPEHEAAPKIGETYYAASSVLVSFTLVLVAIVVMLIPAMLGILLYGVTLLQVDQLGIGWQEISISAFVALLLSTPSIYLMVRYLFAFFVAAHDNFRPVRSLKASRFVTLGYFWPILGRFVMLLVFLAICSVPVSLLTYLVAQLHFVSLTLNTFKFLSSLVALPIFYLYLYRLFQELEVRALGRHAAHKDDEAVAAEDEPAVEALADAEADTFKELSA